MKKAYLFIGLGIGILVVSGATIAYAAGSNYDAWRATMSGNKGRAVETVTEKNFGQFTEMHKLMGEGNYAEAQKIRLELGLGQGCGNGAGGCGMKDGTGRQGGRSMGKQGVGANFIDANKNGVCDYAEAGQIVK